MGNWSPEKDRRRREAREGVCQRRREINERLPKLERPCGTPGAVYTVTVQGNVLGCTAELPFDIEAAIPASAKESMKKALHDAMLPIVEQFYRDVWTKTIAGKTLADDPEPMPERWELLFSKWLRRCLERGERPVVEGRTIFSVYSLPQAYRPEDLRNWPTA
jgi:hypothetical protein